MLRVFGPSLCVRDLTQRVYMRVYVHDTPEPGLCSGREEALHLIPLLLSFFPTSLRRVFSVAYFLLRYECLYSVGCVCLVFNYVALATAMFFQLVEKR